MLRRPHKRALDTSKNSFCLIFELLGQPMRKFTALLAMRRWSSPIHLQASWT